MPVCGSPRLIAACHVLHRLLLPRHPPCALSSLTIKFTQYTGQSAISIRLNLFSLLLIAYCLLPEELFVLCPLTNSAPRGDSHRHTSRESKALIKTYSALCISQIDSVVKNLNPAFAGRRIRDSRTDDPLELFASVRYHIVTESTCLADLLSNVGRQTASTWNRLLLIKTVAVLMPNVG